MKVSADVTDRYAREISREFSLSIIDANYSSERENVLIASFLCKFPTFLAEPVWYKKV